MRRLFNYCLLSTLLAVPTWALAQTPQTRPQPSSSGASSTSEDTRPGTATVSGDTGIWFVPTGEVLADKKWSVSFQRTNMDDGQGFSDISTFPATFGVGVKNRAEVFGAWSLITRIDRDTRPLFFTSTSNESSTGTGGGLLVDYPLNRNQFTSKVGEFWLGAKFNLTSQANNKPVATAVRAMIKLPVGAKEPDGTTSGRTGFAIDAIVSKQNQAVEVSGYGGLLFRGVPSGYTLTNGFRWGFGAAFPQKYGMGIKLSTEVFGESYFDKQITAPAGLFGEDGSPVPTITNLKNPVYWDFGITWQAPNGFYIGAAGAVNLTMSGRSDAQIASGSTPTTGAFAPYGSDRWGLQVRIGYYPGQHASAEQAGYSNKSHPAPPPPPPPPPTPPPPPPPAPANRPPTVRASCDPCTVEVGRTATVTADAQDPDGDPLTYRWTAPSGALSSATSRQTPWTAPQTEGPVRITVTVNDGKGGTASDTVTINVVRPTPTVYNFEDVHFDFDRYTLRPDALRVLDQAVTAMQQNATLRLTIEGHTCNIGTAEYNLALGERRAQAVKDYLVSRGIAADRLTTVSYGEERPKFDNSREETRRLNRRAALTVRLQFP